MTSKPILSEEKASHTRHPNALPTVLKHLISSIILTYEWFIREGIDHSPTWSTGRGKNNNRR